MVGHNNTFKLTILGKIMDKKEKLKMAVISGASHALKYKRSNYRASDDEILQHINREADSIIDKLDSEV